MMICFIYLFTIVFQVHTITKKTSYNEIKGQ
jgi:hypothetical protein